MNEQGAGKTPRAPLPQKCLTVDYDLSRSPDRSWDQEIIDLIGRERHLATVLTEMKLWDPRATVSLDFWFSRSDGVGVLEAMGKLQAFHQAHDEGLSRWQLVSTNRGPELGDELFEETIEPEPTAPYPTVEAALDRLAQVVMNRDKARFGGVSTALLLELWSGSRLSGKSLNEVTSESKTQICELAIEENSESVRMFLYRFSMALIGAQSATIPSVKARLAFDMLRNIADAAVAAMHLENLERASQKVAREPLPNPKGDVDEVGRVS